jgi:hypothetical protein
MPKKIELAVRERVMRMIAEHRSFHGSIGMVPPVEYEQAHYAAPQARDAARMKAAQNLGRFTSEVPERELRGRPVPPTSRHLLPHRTWDRQDRSSCDGCQPSLSEDVRRLGHYGPRHVNECTLQ